MKIALGFKVFNTSWGGGNQFANSLLKAAKTKGYKITNSLMKKTYEHFYGELND